MHACRAAVGYPLLVEKLSLHCCLYDRLRHHHSPSVNVDQIVGSLSLPSREVGIVDQSHLLLDSSALERFANVLEREFHHWLVHVARPDPSDHCTLVG